MIPPTSIWNMLVERARIIAAACNGRRRLALAAALAAVLAALVLMPHKNSKAVALALAIVQRGDVVKEVLATGVIRPEEGAEVKTGSRFTGVISRLHVRLGDHVNKGQLIAELDAREQQYECERLAASLNRLQNELKLLNDTMPMQIRETEALLNIARADKKYADITYRRQQPLRGKGITERELDATFHNQSVSEQNIVLYSRQMERLKGEYAARGKMLAAEIAETEASLSAAKTRLSYATIISPMDGVVSAITAQEGETVVAGLQVVNLITILAEKRLELQIYVDENDIGAVIPGAPVEFTVETYPGRVFMGSVALVHPAPELRDNIVYYRALVRLDEDIALQLRPEMTASCKVLVGKKSSVLLVPNTAFKWIGSNQVIFVAGNGGLHPVVPQTGLRGTENTEILSGLAEGDSVATGIHLPAVLPKEWTSIAATQPAGEQSHD